MMIWHYAQQNGDEVILGELNDGLPAVVVVKRPDGWHVRFANRHDPKPHENTKNAQAAGVKLAKQVLTVALKSLEEQRAGARSPPTSRTQYRCGIPSERTEINRWFVEP